MPKVILHISYEVPTEAREAYLSLAKEMRTQFVDVRKKDYSVYEVKGRKNSFTEEFVCKSMEEFDALEDDLDEKSEELVNRLESLLKEGKAKYTTLIEI